MLERYEKVCKRFLKRKINITVGSVVAILLGTNAFALEMVLNMVTRILEVL